MKRLMILAVLGLTTITLHAQKLTGNWQGAVAGNMSNRFMLQIVRTQAGGFEATLYRIDQSGEPEFIHSVAVESSELRLLLSDGESYDGTINSNSTEIQGYWQGKPGQRQPLNWQRVTKQNAWEDLDSDAAPKVTADDVRIVERARDLLRSPGNWNRDDNRECPKGAKSFSLYCALDRATVEVMGRFEHRGGAMQEARFVIDDNLAKGNHYEHRLMDYNNDPKTTFADVQEFFRLLELRINHDINNGGVVTPEK